MAVAHRLGFGDCSFASILDDGGDLLLSLLGVGDGDGHSLLDGFGDINHLGDFHVLGDKSGLTSSHWRWLNMTGLPVLPLRGLVLVVVLVVTFTTSATTVESTAALATFSSPSALATTFTASHHL